MSLETRTVQLLGMTREDREDLNEENPIIFAEMAPNRFCTMSLFFPEDGDGDGDGVRIQHDLDLNDLTVYYFTNMQEHQITEGDIYEWALKFYEENWAN